MINVIHFLVVADDEFIYFLTHQIVPVSGDIRLEDFSHQTLFDLRVHAVLPPFTPERTNSKSEPTDLTLKSSPTILATCHDQLCAARERPRNHDDTQLTSPR
jgi:hypothetical protein